MLTWKRFAFPREGVTGPKALIGETWERYGLPIAITEAHLGCTREEQLRWLKTQLTDIEQEINGLLTYDRQPKIPAQRIAEIHRDMFRF